MTKTFFNPKPREIVIINKQKVRSVYSIKQDTCVAMLTDIEGHSYLCFSATKGIQDNYCNFSLPVSNTVKMELVF